MSILIKNLGLQDYESVYQSMIEFTQSRTEDTQDQIWLVEHPAVFTQGRHGKPEHIINPKNIPVIQSDRGGQVTYHGPGQAVIYFLFDLKRLNLGVKDFVCTIEKSCMHLLKTYGISSHTIENAPGIYVDQAKIASLGLRVKKGLTYHGLAINVNMDLTPFSYINPCGYQGLKMTQIHAYNPKVSITYVLNDYAQILTQRLDNSIFS
ncbi:lipoyl(octanoyl) transferase LipB [Cysteiniphilum sp. JM-1]|uniref:lipoyl(octanoyl) transferase LipB n=1 Tax=Cysteiniphilum sp. JM-1 TaxID=2610891 RepID=UPI00124680AB|nr:lipoyl(octanoyl) transferase LipB [Cysteiniphilum sp. JM-1]